MQQRQFLEGWYGDADPARCRPSEYYLEKVAQFEAEEVPEGCTVLLGDSITDFGDWDSLLPGKNLINRGIAGDLLEGMALRLDEIARRGPSGIFLLAGTNNFVKHSTATPEAVLLPYRRLLADIRGKMPQAALFVQSILPQNPVSPDWNPHYNSDVEAVNRTLAREAEESGYTYIDIASAMKDTDGNLRLDCTVDGCHLSDRGFALWAAQLLKYITKSEFAFYEKQNCIG